MNDRQKTRLHMAALDYRTAQTSQADECWQALVSEVEALMQEARDEDEECHRAALRAKDAEALAELEASDDYKMALGRFMGRGHE